jgi:hypothetical protein
MVACVLFALVNVSGRTKSMFARMVIGSIVSAVLLMAWGFVFWDVLPYPGQMWKGIPNEDAAIKTLKDDLPESGVYVSPEPRPLMETNEATQEAFKTKHKAGPLVQIFYHKEGIDPMDPMTFGFGFLHYLVSTFLASMLLVMALHSLPSFFGRLIFVFLAGIFGAVFIDGLAAIWLHHDWKYQAFSAGFHASNWLLAGIVLAIAIRPKTAT